MVRPKALERPLYDMRECSTGTYEFVERGGSRGTTTEFWFEYYRQLLHGFGEAVCVGDG
jgi:hypothetical protein